MFLVTAFMCRCYCVNRVETTTNFLRWTTSQQLCTRTVRHICNITLLLECSTVTVPALLQDFGKITVKMGMGLPLLKYFETPEIIPSRLCKLRQFSQQTLYYTLFMFFFTLQTQVGRLIRHSKLDNQWHMLHVTLVIQGSLHK